MPFVEVRTGDAKRRPSNRIMTFEEWCERMSFGRVTGWRVLKSGDGPTVTKISARRIGIREDHHAAWLDSRATKSYRTK